MSAGFLRAWYLASALSLAPTLLFSFRNLWVVGLCFWIPSVVGALKSPGRLIPPRASWPALALAAYFGLSTLWSPNPSALADTIELVALFLLGALMVSQPTARSDVFALGVFLALAVLAIDAVSGNLLRELVPPDQPAGKDQVATARGFGLLLIMLPPALLWMWRSKLGRRHSIRGALLLTGIGTAAAGVLAYGAALLAGIIAMIVTALRPVSGLRLAAAAVGAALLQPFILALTLPPVPVLLTLTELPASALHRLVIWRTLLDRWWENAPVFGAGARASYTLTDRLGTVVLPGGAEVARVSAHAHNLPVEVLFEFGVVGYLLFAACVAAGLWAVSARRWRTDMAAAISALIVGYVVIAVVDLDLWHVHFWTALFLSLLAFRAVAADSRP